jgi:predicted nucleotidyltransferase
VTGTTYNGRRLQQEVSYEEFVMELTRLYQDENYDGHKQVVLFAGEYPEHYARYCEEEGLIEDEE